MTPSGGLCVMDWAAGPAVYLTVYTSAQEKTGEQQPGSVWQFDGTTGAFRRSSSLRVAVGSTHP